MSAQLGGPKLDLTYKNGRRLGITSKNTKLAPLHNVSTNAAPKSDPNSIDLKVDRITSETANPQVLKKFKSQEELLREDEESSEDSSGNERQASADIKPTKFGARSNMQKPEISTRILQRVKPTVYGQKTVDVRPPRRSTRPPASSSQNSTLSSDSTKRKSSGDDYAIGTGIKDATDPFKAATGVKRRKQAAYGSSQTKYGSSQGHSGRGSPTRGNSKASFIKPEVSDSDSEVELETPEKAEPRSITQLKSKKTKEDTVKESITKLTFQSFDCESSDSDTLSSFEYKTMKLPEQVDKSPRNSKPDVSKKFVAVDRLEDSPRKLDQGHAMVFQGTGFDDSFDMEPTRNQRLGTTGDATKLLDQFNLDEEQSNKLGAMLGDELHKPKSFDEEFLSMTQMALCPMCNKPVDPAELRKMGQMSIKKQEKFCQSHQRETAREDWEAEGYPEINWEKLHNRILKHKTFIRELIKGKDCPSRMVLEEVVKTGKERNLLKSTSNITPGYYGSRGLRAISESIMNKHTPLLKKCVVTDNLISARGVTGFVQSVIVPEVTVLLIMEDMKVEGKRAREILTESVGMGELIHEEIRDVVVEIDDSDDDSF